mgnify:CR=1 FL=1
MIHIEQIAPNLTWPIRYQVMYPEHDLDFVKLENDDEGIHFGLYYNQKLTGIVSVFNEGKIYQFRKLAILEEAQGLGLGKKLMEAVIEYCKLQKAENLWCNARANAKDFYKRLGFKETETVFFKDGYDFIIMDLDL